MISTRYLSIFAATLLLMSSCSTNRVADSAATRADAAKADYVFLEAIKARATDRNDSYYELTRHAYDLNPEDKYVGFEHGYNLVRLSDGDSAMINSGYNLMAEYVNNEPEDFYSSVLFAALSSQTGRTDAAISTWGRLHDTYPNRPELAVRYAEVLAASKDSANRELARQIYDTIEITQGPGLQLTSRKIQLHYLNSDTAAMINEIVRLLEKDPLNVSYNIYAGDIYSTLNRGDSALAHYNKAVELDPSNGIAYYSRAGYYRQIGDSLAYDKDIFTALEQDNLDVEPKVEIIRDYTAALYNDSIQRPRIEKMFKRLIEIHPRETPIRNIYRDYLIAIGNYVDAAEQAEYALDIDPADDKQWLALISLQIRNNDSDGAQKSAIRAEHFFPENATIRLLSAATLAQQNDNTGAIKELRIGLQVVDSTDYELRSELYTSIGDNLYAMDSADSAFIYYDKALELNPSNFTALNNCAYYLACTDKDLDKALEMIEKVVDEHPEEATSLDTYAWVLFKMKEYGKALTVIDKAIANSPEPSSELYEHSGDIAFMNREFDRAVEDWKKALKLDPENELLARKVKHQTYFSK